MRNRSRTIRVAVMLSAMLATPLLARAQAPTPATPPDMMVVTIQMGAAHIRGMFAVAAEQMTDADFAFRPTPEVRTFGQLLAHVADANYSFCSSALGEKPPVSGLEKSKTTRVEIRAALTESFDYCDRAYSAMNDSTKARALMTFRTQPMPALALLNFRNYHSLLHWGNAITYVRLRGKVPPSA